MLKREDVRDLMQQALDRAQWQALQTVTNLQIKQKLGAA
jgi:hypothetical protein